MNFYLINPDAEHRGILLIKNIIHSDNFIACHKQKPSDFTRHRKLPFQTLILFMMNLISDFYQKELNNFFQTLMGSDVPKRFVSKAVFASVGAGMDINSMVYRMP
jgi:hypothetical protein